MQQASLSHPGIQAENWQQEYDRLVIDQDVFKFVQIGGEPGVILRFSSKGVAEQFDRGIRDLAYTEGMCFLLYGCGRVYPANEVAEHLRTYGTMPPFDECGYVAAFRHACKKSYLEIANVMGANFTDAEVALISSVLGMLERYTIQLVEPRSLKVGVPLSLAMAANVRIIIERFREVLGMIFPYVSSAKQLIEDIRTDNMLWFADLG